MLHQRLIPSTTSCQIRCFTKSDAATGLISLAESSPGERRAHLLFRRSRRLRQEFIWLIVSYWLLCHGQQNVRFFHTLPRNLGEQDRMLASSRFDIIFATSFSSSFACLVTAVQSSQVKGNLTISSFSFIKLTYLVS